MPEPTLYRAVASCRLNFYPGTLTPTAPDYRRTVESVPMTYDQAVRVLGDWRDAVSDPGCWHLSVQQVSAAPLPSAPPAPANESAGEKTGGVS